VVRQGRGAPPADHHQIDAMQAMAVAAKALAYHPPQATAVHRPPGGFPRDRQPQTRRPVAIVPRANRKTRVDRYRRSRKQRPKIPRSFEARPTRKAGVDRTRGGPMAIRPTGVHVPSRDAPSAPYAHCGWTCACESHGFGRVSADSVERFSSLLRFRKARAITANGLINKVP